MFSQGNDNAQTYLEVVSMLPHVNAKDGDLPTDDRVLVLGGDDAQRVPILDEPAPSGALDAHERAREAGLKGLRASPGGRDGGREGRSAGLHGGDGAVGGGEVLPEEAVVDVASAVELDGGLQRNLVWDRCRRVPLQRRIQVRDVRLVVLAVVQLHNLRRDGRLKRLVPSDMLAIETWRSVASPMRLRPRNSTHIVCVGQRRQRKVRDGGHFARSLGGSVTFAR